MWNAILINIKWKLFSKIENEIESAPSRHMIFISCWSPMKDSTIYWMHCGRFPQEKHMWYMCECVCVCVCCAHMQCELYRNRILNEVIRRGEAYAEKTSMELCIFFSCKWYGGSYPLLTFSWYMHAGKYLDFTASISYRFNQVNIFFPEINVLASESKENVKFEIRNI